MDIKLFASELKVMSVLWRDGDVPAKYIAKLLTASSAAPTRSPWSSRFRWCR